MGITAVRELGEALHALVGSFDAEIRDGDLAKDYVTAFGYLERLAVGGKTLALAQVDRTRAWSHGGSPARSTADWLAGETGASLGDAIRETNTARNLDGLGATEEALRDGRLSARQTAAITDAATDAPGAEKTLLGLSQNGSFEALRKRARQEKAAADESRKRSERQHSLRRARGHTIGGESCELAGVGPIDVASAKRLFGDAIVDIIIKDGVDVRTVAHAGRSANKRQKAALLINWECEIQGCSVTRDLEIDHIISYAMSGQSDLEHLGPKCRWHHSLKTHKGWTDGPRDPDGKRTLIPPKGHDPPDRPSPPDRHGAAGEWGRARLQNHLTQSRVVPAVQSNDCSHDCRPTPAQPLAQSSGPTQKVS